MNSHTSHKTFERKDTIKSMVLTSSVFLILISIAYFTPIAISPISEKPKVHNIQNEHKHIESAKAEVQQEIFIPEARTVEEVKPPVEHKEQLKSIENQVTPEKKDSKVKNPSKESTKIEPEKEDPKKEIGRKLINYVPGTMGQKGAKPLHHCKVKGSVSISYTVDKQGNVISAKKSGGSNDACLVSTGISWVKKYVKTEKGSGTFTGIYHINF